MKKMIGFGAALLCAAVGFADVEGANVVGYQNLETDSETTGSCIYPTFGFTFQPMGDEAGWVSLGSVKMENMDAYMGDYLYKLEPDEGTPDGSCYIYFDYANSLLMWQESGEQFTEQDVLDCIGWWELFSYDPNDKIDDVEIKAGTFLMGDVQGAQNIKIACAGEAQKDVVPVTLTGLIYPTFANPIPREITLKEITIAGMDAYMGDYIYALEPTEGTPDGSCYIYFDYANSLLMWEESGEQYTEQDVLDCVGWWELFSYDPNDKIDDLPIAAGKALMGDFNSSAAEGGTTVIAFPAAYTPAAN